MAIMARDPLQHTSMYERCREESEDSDGEGGLGNVNRLIMRPSGHSGKAKRGHLCFDASFETGNLGRVDLINEYEYDLFIRPDTCNPRFRFWFNFTVDNVKQDQRVIFNIVNMSKSRNMYNSNMTPIVKSTTRSKWQRIPKRHVFYTKSAAHQGNYILSFAFAFDKEDEVYQFALAPPYSYSKLQQYLSRLETKALYLDQSFKREQLGTSVQKRRLDMLTIGPVKRSGERRRVVAVMARIHPGDSASSFVCQGLIELLISSHPVASLLREYVIFKIVPMMNPDGVYLGNFRSTLMGFDLNRSWHIISPWAHPTLKAVADLLISLDKSKDLQFDFVLDIHAQSSLKGCFIYGNTYEDVYRYERHIVFPKLLATVADDYAANNTMFNADSSKAGTARRHFCTVLSDKVNCYTFEVSIFGYHSKGNENFVPYNEASYMRCGRNLARTFLEYYQITGAIPAQLLLEIMPKKRRAKSHSSRSRMRDQTKIIQRPKTSRMYHVLHFTDLNLNYDSETSGEELHCSYRSPLGHGEKQNETIVAEKQLKKFGSRGGLITSGIHLDSPPPSTFMVAPPPSLSIIDFNFITRNTIDEAVRKTKLYF